MKIQKESDDKRTKHFIDFWYQIKEEEKNIDIRLFNKYFTYKAADKMVQFLHNSKSKAENKSAASLIMNDFE